jgi:hypothetical protein
MNFSDWLEDDEGLVSAPLLLGMLEYHRQWRERLLSEGPLLLSKGERDFKLQFPGRHFSAAGVGADSGGVIQGPDDNYLIPYQSLKQIMGLGLPADQGSGMGKMSMFLRDAPYIAAYSQASPENMASTIIFVLMTIRANFMSVMQDFPVVMTMLMARHQGAGVSGEGLASDIGGMEKRLSSMSNKATRAKSTTVAGKEFRTGYGLGTTFFGTKYNGVAKVWSQRQEIYSSIMELVSKKDTVAVFEYLLQNISGLAQAKAGFCVQLIFGELGCIDMHNVNLYSQYYLDREGQKRGPGSFRPDHFPPQSVLTMRNPLKRDKDMYAALDPTYFSEKPAPIRDKPGREATSRDINTYRNRKKKFREAVKRYIDVLEGLERDGFNTIKLWDIWVSYVSRTHVSPKGKSWYSRTGLLSGNPMNPGGDSVDASIMGVHGPIPDRNTLVTSRDSQISWEKDGPGGAWQAHKVQRGGGVSKQYSMAGMDQERSAGAASGAHGATWWWRTPEYWWDQIAQARERGTEARDGFRYRSLDRTGPSTIVSKPLAYLASDPEMLRTVFADDAERRRFEKEMKDVLGMWNFWKQPSSDVKKWKKR